jgi:hypothetical protein
MLYLRSGTLEIDNDTLRKTPALPPLFSIPLKRQAWDAKTGGEFSHFSFA